MELYIKCSICKDAHNYKYSNDSITALNAQWRDPGGNDLLETLPIVGEHYEIVLYSSVRMNLSEPFWIVYKDRMSTIEGIEEEENILSLRFCKCEFVKIINKEDRTALLEIVVQEVKEITDIQNEYHPFMSWYILFTDLSTFQENGSIYNFKKYSFVTINAQSDLGIDLIIYKENGLSRIVAAYNWDFHLDEWVLCNISLTKEEEEKYGIEHL